MTHEETISALIDYNIELKEIQIHFDKYQKKAKSLVGRIDDGEEIDWEQFDVFHLAICGWIMEAHKEFIRNR